MRLRFVFARPSVQDERSWERENVLRKSSRYLESNPLDRLETDDGWRRKVAMIDAALEGVAGLVLDVGGNTAGEATVLQQRGRTFVVTDINEQALSISRQRALRFGLKPPEYVAADAHRLPFADGCFAAATVIEALHHLPEPEVALREAFRVLRPGGRLICLEPNALDPLRRASEMRDRFSGTIETSFYPWTIKRLVGDSGFESIRVSRFSSARSSWKLQEVPAWRRWMARLHGQLGVQWPVVFGELAVSALKPGQLQREDEGQAVPSLLRSPIGGGVVIWDPESRTWVDSTGGVCFPDEGGIPVLVAGDARPLANHGSRG